MGTTLSNGARSASANGTVDLLDVGSSNPNGRMVFTTAGDVAVATLNMSNPAFGNAANGVATANPITSDTNAAGGVTTRCQFRDRNNAEVFRCNVGVSGSDINLSTTTIPVGGTVAVTSVTYTQPAGSTT